MKKNIILLLTAAVLTLSVTGCSSSKFSVIESDSLLESTVTSQVSVQSAVSGSEITAEDGYGEGRIGDVMHTYFFDYTVNSVRVAAEYEGYVPAEGNQMLIAEVTVKNTGTQSIEMYDTDFQAQWNDDAEDAYRFPITTDPETFDELPVLNEEQLPGTYPLAVDEEASLLFVVVYSLLSGLVSVALFMLVMFRLPGFVAMLTLLGQLAITFAAVSGYFPFLNSFTMTLPGIAGIILSIGVGVDANIITASRIKEELYSGKTLDGAIHRGCSNSLWSIVDGNITILIVAVMLIGVFGPSNILSQIFGASTTGAIYSFGYTLLVGVIGNFIMGVFFSRLMIKSLSGFKPLRKKWLFGGSDKA